MDEQRIQSVAYQYLCHLEEAKSLYLFRLGLAPQIQDLYGKVEFTDERLTAEEMDEQRIQSVAYQYLCHLEEAKRWMEACLNEELPAPTELEEGLRNGVLLAKLGHCFTPHIVPLKKIYDCQQERYKVSLHCSLHCSLLWKHSHGGEDREREREAGGGEERG
ncbi:UNVERIFIED_CONTAM: hypothetical protein FKN15_057656 [Acipenser sinensis]